jgi:hypothetical protein
LRAVGLSLTPNSSQSSPDINLAGVGFVYRHRASRFWSVELASDLLWGTAAGNAFQRSSIPLTASIMLHFPPTETFSFYGIAGGGVVFDEITFDGSLGNASQSFVEGMLYAGGGAELRLGPLAIVGDLRAVWLARAKDGDHPSWSDDGGPVARRTRGAQFNLGILYCF